MKTHTIGLVVAALGVALGPGSFAGPGAQYFRERVETTPAATRPANDGMVLMCSHMLARNAGPTAHRNPWVSVTCTEEMLKNDRECQSACGVPLPVKALPTQPTCEHMLTSRTGYHRIPFLSTRCTQEMLENDPECQSACKRAAG